MKTSVAESFRNGTVLITGSTGFFGKVLTEKLLRSCPVKNIVILVRSKKGYGANERVADMFKQAVSKIKKLWVILIEIFKYTTYLLNS